MSIRSNVDRAALNERVTFTRDTLTQNAQGDPVNTPVTLGTFWARVDGTKVGERWQDPEVASGLRTVSSYTVWIRSDVFVRLALTAADKVLWRDEEMEILDIPDQQLRGRLIALICRKGLVSG